MNINKITIKILLEGVGICWSLLECWSVGTVFCFWEMQIFFFCLLKIRESLI